MSTIFEEIKNLYQIICFKPFRSTPGVTFDMLDIDSLKKIDSIDRVIHKSNSVSPGKVGNVERPWYMHKFQDDNLIVLYGERNVDIYNKEHGKVENFIVTPDKILKNGKVIFEGGAILVWPRGVFHRIVSGEKGSVSLNLAVHYEGFDIKDNFSIYDLDTKNGTYEVLKKGFENQF